jgi:hypothetical protein
MSINHIPLDGKKIFAIFDSYNYVIDCWLAETLEEAKTDNPGKKVIEIKKEHPMFTLGEKYDKEIDE